MLKENAVNLTTDRKLNTMGQRQLLEFMTPQHPSAFGTNKWGGASPLLARDIPKEALEQRYVRLNAVRDRDQIFPLTTVEEVIFSSPPPTTIGDEIFSFSMDNAATRRWKGLVRKMKMWRPRKRRTLTLGSKPGSKWFRRWDPKNRWPNGWC